MAPYKFPPKFQEDYSETITRKEDNKMNNVFNSNKILDRMFRKADGVVWDMMTGKIGIQTDDGIVTLEGEGDSASIVQNLFDEFGVPLPAFAQSVPVSSVNVGDVIYRGTRNNVAWVIEKSENKNSFRLIKPNGERVSWTPPKVQMLGFDSGVMVLRSLVNMLPGGEKDVNSLQSMMLPMLMMGGDMFGDGSMDKMMPLMLMQMMNSSGTGTANNNLMMPLLMMQMMKK